MMRNAFVTHLGFVQPNHRKSRSSACLEYLEQRSLLSATIVHDGILNTQADFDRMASKIAANASPWVDSWRILLSNPHAQLTYAANPVATLIRGTTTAGPENYSYAMNDAAAAYQTALRWKITGDTAYADKSIQILNAWGSTCTNIDGDSNQFLAAGFYGYEFAVAGEMMRGYSGWASADFTQFKNMMNNVFYAHNLDFLTNHNGAANDHYWANWDLSNVASVMAIGVLLDNKTIYDYGMNYFENGVGNGNINNGLYYLHPGKLGQWQESGRDQGHNVLAVPLLGTIAQIAWNQGDDLYSYNDNAILAATEYIAKYNTGSDVPYVTYINSDVVQSTISATGRGTIRPGFDLIYNHYTNMMGIAAPYTALYAAHVRPEGGGGDYGTTSGGFDQLGFTTLTATLDPIAAGARPSGLTAAVKGALVELSWWGSAYATSYNVKRATSLTGPYTTIATNVTGPTTFTDTGIASGVTYYYVVSGVSPAGETANSDAASAVRNDRLVGTVIGSAGSYGSKGATIVNVFDGTTRNYYDALNATGDWAGLDFGDGVTNAITQVRYAPRRGFASRMVGGQFQGSNDPTFASGVVTLYTITTAPTEGVMTSATISNASAFRYVRYLGPTNGSCNVAEVEFYGYNVAASVPAVPTGLSATANETGVSLSWTASSGAVGYDIKRATVSGGPYATIATGVASTGFSDTGTADGVPYYYVISAANAAGNSAASAQVSATTLARPTGLTVTSAGLMQLNLSWIASAGATSYSVKRSLTNAGPYTVIGTVTGTSFNDSTVSAGVPYYYVVSAVTTGAQSRNSTEASGVSTATKLSGTIIGTAGSWSNNPATTKEAAMDGNIATYFDANVASGAWVGLDLGNATVICNVRYVPRSGLASRMVGGIFQGANAADFTGAVDLFTVTAAPAASVYTAQAIANPTAFRYVRYLSPANGYCNAAELEFYTVASSNAAPTVATAAAATPSPVTGSTTALSVLGADDGGEAALTYTWSATGPAAVTYSANGTNAAKNATATFTAAGSYAFTATITDAGGLSVTSTVNVTVNQTLTAITVSPATATLNTNATQQFTASGTDQFGTAMAASYTWSVIAGGGTIDTAGLYTAAATAGSATIQAASGTLRQTASVTIVAPAVPAAPTNLTGSRSRSRARLSWKDNSTNESGFHVWSSRDGVTWTLRSVLGAASGSGGTVFYTSSNLASGTWYFKVTSYNAAGDSTASNIVSILI